VIYSGRFTRITGHSSDAYTRHMYVSEETVYRTTKLNGLQRRMIESVCMPSRKIVLRP